MQVLALYHMKGGVGKTAAAVNLAYLAAQSGARTLLCDLDPQASATYYFRIQPKLKAKQKVFARGGKHLEKSIKATDFAHLDLLPGRLVSSPPDGGVSASQTPGTLPAPQPGDASGRIPVCDPRLSVRGEPDGSKRFLCRRLRPDSRCSLTPVGPCVSAAPDVLHKTRLRPQQTPDVFLHGGTQKKLHQSVMRS